MEQRESGSEPTEHARGRLLDSALGRPQPRADVAALPAYVPGARPADPSVRKLSSNENPYPPLESVRQAIAHASAEINRYPQMYGDALVSRIADLYEVAPAEVVVGNGSVAVLGHVLEAFTAAGDEVISAWRSFEAYPILIALQGAAHVPVPLTVDARHDLPAMAAAVTDRTRAVLLCSPNNPTGPALRRAEVVEFLQTVPRSVLVVLDEAYAEFCRDETAVDGTTLLGEHPNLLVLRTFSKAYGLAGLRVGFAIGSAEVCQAVRAAATPFGVNALAVAAATASIDAQEELLGRVAELVAERARVVAALAAQGWSVPDQQGNFFWLSTGALTMERAGEATAAGILVRPFAGEGMRITIGTPDENDAVLALTARWAAEE